LSVVRNALVLRRLREQPLWRLLAADKAASAIACLQALLLEEDRILTQSALEQRLHSHLEALKSAGEMLPQTPAAYIADWLSQGWLLRRLPTGSSEEVYELSADAAQAIRFVASITTPRAIATESRLATVIYQLSKLAEETDADPKTRMEALLQERARIDREIDLVANGAVKVLSADRALERAREIMALAEELTGDFRRVRDRFSNLNRSLRQSLLEGDESRGEVLEALFAGIDLIADSDEGRTFAAFWRLLTDPEQMATLDDAVSSVVGRPFAEALEPSQRRFLMHLITTLSNEGGTVHDVLQNFSRSLKNFVQSREFLEQRRLHSLLKDAQRAAIEMTQHVRLNFQLGYMLTLTSSSIRSVSQLRPADPSGRPADLEMIDAPDAEIGLDTVAALITESEIDFRTLRSNIRVALAAEGQISIEGLMQAFAAPQGLGTVVGYLTIGVKDGVISDHTTKVSWTTTSGLTRRASVPLIFFTKESYPELE
jgi:hypothetical protein